MWLLLDIIINLIEFLSYLYSCYLIGAESFLLEKCSPLFLDSEGWFSCSEEPAVGPWGLVIIIRLLLSCELGGVKYYDGCTIYLPTEELFWYVNIILDVFCVTFTNKETFFC